MLNLVVVWESMPNLWPTISIGVIVFLVLFAMLAEKSTTHSGVIIGVEGNISSGKSTLCSTLQNQVCQSTKQPIRVMFEEISSLLLQLFYSDHKRYALTLQLTTLQRRIDNLVHIKKSVAEQKNIGLLDRSTMGDVLFAVKQYLDGAFNNHEAAVYVSEFSRGVLSRAFFVDKVLYLHSTPELCRNRVAQRGNVDKDVQHDYLNDIHLLHIYGLVWLLLNRPDRQVYVADWRHFGDAQRLLGSLVNNSTPPSSLRWDRKIGEVKKDITIVSSTQDIDAIASGLIAIDSLPSTVFFPYNLALEKLPNSCLPLLPKNMRMVHSAQWQNALVSCLANKKKVVLYCTEDSRPTTMLDLFDHLGSQFCLTR